MLMKTYVLALYIVTFLLTLSQEETFWFDGFLVHPYEDTLAKLSLEVPEMFVR